MALIKPKQKTKNVQQRITIDATILEDTRLYCEYAGFDKLDEFIQEALVHILSKDKEFKEWKETKQMLNETADMPFDAELATA